MAPGCAGSNLLSTIDECCSFIICPKAFLSFPTSRIAVRRFRTTEILLVLDPPLYLFATAVDDGCLKPHFQRLEYESHICLYSSNKVTSMQLSNWRASYSHLFICLRRYTGGGVRSNKTDHLKDYQTSGSSSINSRMARSVKLPSTTPNQDPFRAISSCCQSSFRPRIRRNFMRYGL